MSKKAFLVALREFHENVRTKTFWIGIFVFPLILTLAMVVPSLLEGTKDVRRYAVVDHSDWLLEEVERRAAMPDLEKVFRATLERYREGGKKFEELPEVLREIAPRLEKAMEFLGSATAADEEKLQEIEDLAIEQVAMVMTRITGVEGAAIRSQLPQEAIDSLNSQREAIRRWWEELPPEEAEDFGSQISKGRYVRVEAPGEGEDAIGELNRWVADGDLFGYFVIGADPVESSEGSRYVSTNLTDEDLREWFEYHATAAVRERRLAQREIEPEVAQWLQEPLDFELKRIAESGEEEEVAAEDRVRQWAPVVFVYLLWIAVFSIAQMLLTNTVEEKSNRIMEVLLSSISPVELMAGKIAGIAMTGLTVVLSWVVFFFLAVQLIPRLMGIEIGFNLGVIAADPIFLTSFVGYFLLGYLLFAALLVGIGAVCNSLKEAQNLMTPVTLVLFVPLLTMVPVGQDPNGTLARVLSYIPPLTPFVMMNRAAGPPSTLDYVLTTILLLVTIAAVLWGAAKIFRIGILMTGKPPKVGEILKWLKAPVGTVPERKALAEPASGPTSGPITRR